MSHQHTTDHPDVPMSGHALDQNDLDDLKLNDSDLDDFARYFEMAFEGSTLTVLVALLQRLCAVENLRKQKRTGIWIEDIVCRLTHLLYVRSGVGFERACRFGSKASDAAEWIFAESRASSNTV